MKAFALAYWCLGIFSVVVFDEPPQNRTVPFIWLGAGYLLLGGLVLGVFVHAVRFGSIFDPRHRTFTILAPIIYVIGLLCGWWLMSH